MGSMEPRGRILVVSNFYPPRAQGGAEVVAHRHALLMKSRGWNVSAFAGMQPSAEFPPGTVHLDCVDGIEVVLLALRSLDPADNFRWALADNVFRSIIQTLRPDWVHAHNVIGLSVDLISIAKQAGVRVAVTLHDNWGYCFKHTRLRNNGALCRDTEECHLCRPTIGADPDKLPIRLRRDYVRYRLEQADILVSPSHDLAARYVEGGIGLEHIVVQSNGIDLSYIQGRTSSPPASPVRFLCAAYIGEHKGIPVLLEALKLLDEITELAGRWSLTIAGHGHLSGMVEQAIARHDWQQHVMFLGRRPRAEVLRLMLESHVVVLPSSWPENEPVILMEAIALGTATIASRLGGNVDLVKDNQTGFLFEPGNAPELAAAMRRFIEQPDLAGRFGRANLSLRSTFDEGEAVDKMEALFKTAAAPARTTSRIIICGGHFDARGMVLVGMLAKILPGYQLLWHKWLHAGDWDRAGAYWQLSPSDDAAHFAEALKRDIPVITPYGSLVEKLEAGGLPIYPYTTIHELGLVIQRAFERERTPPSTSAARGFYRFSLQVRKPGDFLMMAQS